MLQIIKTKDRLQNILKGKRERKRSLGFVPTMGALHQGHLSLVNQAKQENGVVLVSIFVNPTQFNNPLDLEKYPRPIDADIELLKSAECDILFVPEISEMYSPEETWYQDLDGMDEILEGAFRPGHYQGVTQIVYKLFDLIQPHAAYFGQKDFQQFLILQKLTDKLNLPIRMVCCPTIREKNGLAMSSRNIHLNPEERNAAQILFKALSLAKDLLKNNSEDIVHEQVQALLKRQAEVKIEYFEIVNAHTLKPKSQPGEPLVALVAAKVGSTRLIDSILIDP